ncbi:UDP-3-O-(3-hydroxymyristoyl)glucosamine N-acyltransferase [Prosthecobacter fluviatilis]|uniref:UDP-3-O-acylglucosamine N-acyltransferase n=1 Tax=Prosthecobacter fluviatilis TaxID=445931 RepID=A0ABW0KTK9_9BACT
MSHSITLQKLAELVGGTLSAGSPESVISGLNSLMEAGPGDVTFLGNARYLPALKTTRASAALVPEDLDAGEAREGLALIRLKNPTLAFSHVIRFFGPPAVEFAPGVHPTATVAEDVVFDPQKVSIGPHAVIESGVRLGDGCRIHAGVYLGRGVQLGAECVIHANAVIKEYCVLGRRVILHSGSVIGSDGFGYELVQGRHQKIDQVGIVQIDDDVEIGSCTTIDRARFGRTWIGEGSKIDNLVQIGHNCTLGKHCIIVSQTGISGSTRLGNYVTMGGQVGVAGHLEIGDRVMFLAKSGVTKSIHDAGAYTGYPARPLMEGRKMLSLPAKIPDLLERVRVLEKKLAALEGEAVRS